MKIGNCKTCELCQFHIHTPASKFFLVFIVYEIVKVIEISAYLSKTKNMEESLYGIRKI